MPLRTPCPWKALRADPKRRQSILISLTSGGVAGICLSATRKTGKNLRLRELFPRPSVLKSIRIPARRAGYFGREIPFVIESETRECDALRPFSHRGIHPDVVQSYAGVAGGEAKISTG